MWGWTGGGGRRRAEERPCAPSASESGADNAEGAPQRRMARTRRLQWAAPATTLPPARRRPRPPAPPLVAPTAISGAPAAPATSSATGRCRHHRPGAPGRRSLRAGDGAGETTQPAAGKTAKRAPPFPVPARSTAAAAAQSAASAPPTGASAAHAKGAQKPAAGGVCGAAAAAPAQPPPRRGTHRGAPRGSAAAPRLDSRPSSACRGASPPDCLCCLASGEEGVGDGQQGLAAGRPGRVRHRPPPFRAESGERTAPPAGRQVWQPVGQLAQEGEL